MTTSHDYRLALTADQRAAELADREAAPGAVVKFATCHCDDGAHGYPDRVGWVVSEDLALEDLAETAPNSGHVVIRFTAVIDDARAALIGALAKSDGLTGDVARSLLHALYGPTADRLIDALGGAR